MLNIELLLKVKEAILAHPEHFDMGDWIEPSTSSEHDAEETVVQQLLNLRCGTTACIAGWAVSLAMPKASRWEVSLLSNEVLGLSGDQCDELFYSSHWPEPFRTQYRNADERKSHTEMAQIAAARIDAFIEQYDSTPAPVSGGQG